jgi:hypothetical protein
LLDSITQNRPKPRFLHLGIRPTEPARKLFPLSRRHPIDRFDLKGKRRQTPPLLPIVYDDSVGLQVKPAKQEKGKAPKGLA